MTRATSVAGALVVVLAVFGMSTVARAQSFPLLRTVAAPGFTPQASFYNPVRDELVVISFGGTDAQIYDSDGDLVRATAALPTPLGDRVDGAGYDNLTGVALVIRQTCEVLELDPVTLTISTRRSLGGSPLVPAPTLCAGVDVGSDGLLYVADYNSSRVVVYPRVGTVPLRDFTVALAAIDNLSRAPGTDLVMLANNTAGQFALYRESGLFVSGPSPIGTGIILGDHTRSNSAGSDGLTFIGTSGRLWFCDHNDPVLSCYLQTRGCTGAADCPLPFIGCDVPSGLCRSATCGDGSIEGGEECDDGDVTSGDGCSAGCVVEPGFVCNGEPSVCGTCTDSTVLGTDTGCTAERPHCRTTGPRAPQCEVCLDDTGPGMGDFGCTPATPFCLRTSAGVNACFECLADVDCDDRNDCTTESCSASNACVRGSVPRGDACSVGVCAGPGDERCVECVSDAQCAAGFVCDPVVLVCALARVDASIPPLPDVGVPPLPDADIFPPDAALAPPDAFVMPGTDAAIVPPDAAVIPDAGSRDAGAGDAGARDAAAMDAATEEPDAAVVGGTFTGGAACSVSTGEGARASWAAVLAALAMLVARRRACRRGR